LLVVRKEDRRADRNVCPTFKTFCVIGQIPAAEPWVTA